MMGMVFPVTVSNVEYVEREAANGLPADMLRVDFAKGGSSSQEAGGLDDSATFDGGNDCVYVENGNYTPKNPALAVMAYLGARPSNLEAAEGETLPVVVTADGGWAVAGIAIQQGRQLLADADWFSADSTDGTKVEIE